MGESETPRRRPRPHPRSAEGGRRLHSAGSAVVVALAGLFIALLLNAPGLHKSATIQPDGWKRETALAVTGPLDGVSGALLLDRPRRALKAVLGRSGDDEIDTAVVVAEPSTQDPAIDDAPAAPVTRKVFSPGRPLRLWIAGDSLVVVPGESLLRALARNRSVVPVGEIDGRIASGLERPDVFNWFTHVREEMRSKKPHAVVVMFGGNDDHGFMTGVPEGKEIGSFGSPSWSAEYRRRVAGIMDTINRSGAFLVWIGLPISQDAVQTQRYDTINAIVQSEAARRAGWTSYLDTYFFFAGADGGFSEYVPDDTGKLEKMRADDGVHFERPAGDLIAEKVLERLEERFDFSS